ncbi:MAG: YggT family protein [Chloroflexales bacterium]|nr:YggT family protein [Chloroflexales bacterium]
MSDFLVMFIQLLFQVLTMTILARVLLSWVDPTGNMRISQVLRDLTEPILAPIRSILPNIGMIDLSPLVALLLLQVIGSLLLRVL